MEADRTSAIGKLIERAETALGDLRILVRECFPIRAR